MPETRRGSSSTNEKNEDLETLKQLVNEHNKKIELLINENKDLKNEIRELNLKINKTNHENEAKCIPKSFASLFTQSTSSVTKSTILKSLNQEKNDQAKRQNNLIVSGIPIAKSEQNDLQVINELMKDLDIPQPREEIITQRFGKHNETTNSKKIKITLPQETRQQLIKKAKDLRMLPRWNNIYINFDLTPAQQEEQYNLRCELRNNILKEPNKRWIIKNGVVMEKKLTSRPNSTIPSEL